VYLIKVYVQFVTRRRRAELTYLEDDFFRGGGNGSVCCFDHRRDRFKRGFARMAS